MEVPLILNTLLFSTSAEIFLQLVTAMALGMLIGAERETTHQTAGLRTFGLVAMGACLFTLLALNVDGLFATYATAIDPAQLRIDVFRVVAAVITGIGFLGAGVIIFKDHGQTVTGLSTAASLWVAAGIGIAVAFELYGVAVATTLLTLIILSVFQWLEKEIFHFDPR